ncbi:MAG: aldo/keto reductase [Acidobacteriota bacterium]
MSVDRRAFLRLSAAGLPALSLSCGGAGAGDVPAPPTGRAGASYAGGQAILTRTLGKTGIVASEIGFGGFPVQDPDVVDYAIDRGITYIDTAQGYRGGDSEATIGKVMRRRRAEVTLTTKYRWKAEVTKDQMQADIDGSLRRLQTDHVDFLLVHQVGKPSDGEGIERLKNPDLFEAVEAAKKAGKVRHLGVSGHDGDLMEVMGYAIDTGLFEMCLMRYSFLDYPEQAALIKKAKEKGIAVVAMKTLAGAKGADVAAFRDRRTSFKQAALKWVLSNPDVSTLIISIGSKDQVDEYAAASGSPVTHADAALLEEYAARFGREVCRFCNACEPACPAGVKVADVLRASMYHHDYAEPALAQAAFQAIDPAGRRDACASCGAPCLAACGYRVDVKSEVRKAMTALARGEEVA